MSPPIDNHIIYFMGLQVWEQLPAVCVLGNNDFQETRVWFATEMKSNLLKRGTMSQQSCIRLRFRGEEFNFAMRSNFLCDLGQLPCEGLYCTVWEAVWLWRIAVIWSLTLLWLAYFWVLSQVQMSLCWYLYIDPHCNSEGTSVVIDLRRLEN